MAIMELEKSSVIFFCGGVLTLFWLDDFADRTCASWRGGNFQTDKSTKLDA